MKLSDDIALAHQLAEAAGAAIRPFFRAPFEHEAKGDASPVTEADRAAELAMRDLLAQHRTADGIIGEEYGSERGESSRVWVLDPIDGTTSFMAGKPTFGTLIALLQDGWPVLGVIAQPISGERWVGAMGQGTTLNGKAIRSRSARGLADMTLASTGPQYFDNHQAEHFMTLAAKTAHKRIVWGGDCYNYGLLAGGHIDLVVEAGLKIHDFAALVPIVEGAGGMMCDWNGEPLDADSQGDVIACGDPARMDDVLEALACGH